MLFVSCENEPKERVATMKDAEIVFGLISYAEGEPVTGTKEVNEDGTIKFNEAVYKDEEDNVQIGHRVCDIWWAVSNKLKFNSGRQNVRRYIALMTNRALRKEVFGI